MPSKDPVGICLPTNTAGNLFREFGSLEIDSTSRAVLAGQVPTRSLITRSSLGVESARRDLDRWKKPSTFVISLKKVNQLQNLKKELMND